MEELSKCKGFDWDDGNSKKNSRKHNVNPSESEQIFFNEPLFVINDVKHSEQETRYYALGRTDKKRLLYIAFTIRKNLIRVISARDMSRKERKVYEQKT
jgi:hypothetical protein